VASAGACVAGLTGGTTAALGAFNTVASPYLMPAGSSQIVCFELKLASAAPMTAEGGSTTFTMNLVADERLP
jgi:hypothetical protein